MNRDTILIWESYALLSELAVSEANTERLMRKYNISQAAAYLRRTRLRVPQKLI